MPFVFVQHTRPQQSPQQAARAVASAGAGETSVQPPTRIVPTAKRLSSERFILFSVGKGDTEQPCGCLRAGGLGRTATKLTAHAARVKGGSERIAFAIDAYEHGINRLHRGEHLGDSASPGTPGVSVSSERRSYQP